MRISGKNSVPVTQMYFTENGDVWTPESKQGIASAVLIYPDNSIKEGQHNGRFFNGQSEIFGSDSLLKAIYVYDANGDINEEEHAKILTQLARMDGVVRLANNLSTSPAASQYLKTLAL